MLDRLLYLAAVSVIGIIRILPLPLVAMIGRGGGALFYYVDARHRGVARENVSRCFPEKSKSEVRAIVCENFKRIGEAFACAAKTAYMTLDQVLQRSSVEGLDKIQRPAGGAVRNRIIAVGHFANFELYGKMAGLSRGYKGATTYRGLRQRALDELLLKLRERSGCRFFERRTQASELKQALNEGGTMLGLFADQHAGRGGTVVPFFGIPCSTTAAPAVLALRYDCPLQTAVCYRTSLARWKFEVGDEIPLRENGQARTTEAITADLNKAFEVAIRRDPANWFWVHNRWKTNQTGKGRKRASSRGAVSAS